MNPGKQQICSRFVTSEKLADLRTEREREIMHGRPWTRELPPPPVLPPYGPLEKISGQLETFSSECFREYFDADAYRTSTLPEVSDGQRGAAAAVAIVAGSPGAGVAMMTESESSNNTAEFVQGMINGKPFRGWVGTTRLQAGDNVDMIAGWQHDHYEVYAIALPEERIVSMCPKCDMGHIAHMLWRIKNMLVLTAISMVLFILALVIRGYLDEDNNFSFYEDYLVATLIMLVTALSVSGLIAFFAYRACASTYCKLAEEILSLIGEKNVSRVNLRARTKRREQQLKDNGVWCDPEGKNNVPCPSSKYIYSDESWFYY